MKVIVAGRAVSEADIQALEAAVGLPLPTDFKAFLLAHNARQIRPCILPTPTFPRSEKVVLHQLTCFCPGTTADFNYRITTFTGRIPFGMLPIGSDPGGNLFLLDLSNAGGAVYFWERAFEVEEGEVPTRDNVFRVAPNFTSFLADLVDD